LNTVRDLLLEKRGNTSSLFLQKWKIKCNVFWLLMQTARRLSLIIMQLISILRKIKKWTNCPKSIWKCTAEDLFTFRKWWCHTRKTTKTFLSVDCIAVFIIVKCEYWILVFIIKINILMSNDEEDLSAEQRQLQPYMYLNIHKTRHPDMTSQMTTIAQE